MISFSDVSLISQPTITIVGTSDNRTISIRHNTTVPCVRNIAYCLNTSDTELECNYSINLNDLILKYPTNSTFATLSIVYDIIYVKYSFDINITQNTDEGKRYSQKKLSRQQKFFQVVNRK